jgi:Skp family chaperone for outer membrane proteins
VIHRLLFALFLSAALTSFPAHAAKVMEMEAEDMVRAAGHVKDTLALSPNQQTLWQQVASKSGALLRVRQSRREKLQADLKARLADPRQEWRELAAAVESESAASAGENRQLRELWLTLGDALTDQQRQLVAQFLASQLERVEPPPRADGPGAGRGEPPQGGHRRQKPEGAGGAARF